MNHTDDITLKEFNVYLKKIWVPVEGLADEIVKSLYPRLNELIDRFNDDNVNEAYLFAWEVGIKEDIKDVLGGSDGKRTL